LTPPQSAVCYLTPELAKLGQRFTLATRAAEPKLVREVRCQPIHDMEDGVLRNADCVVQCSGVIPARLAQLKALCRPDALHILWTHHAHDQPAVANLAEPEIRALVDGFARSASGRPPVSARRSGSIRQASASCATP